MLRWMLHTAIWRKNTSGPERLQEELFRKLLDYMRRYPRISTRFELPDDKGSMLPMILSPQSLKPSLPLLCHVFDVPLYDKPARYRSKGAAPGYERSHIKPFIKHGEGDTFLEPAPRNRAKKVLTAADLGLDPRYYLLRAWLSEGGRILNVGVSKNLHYVENSTFAAIDEVYVSRDGISGGTLYPAGSEPSETKPIPTPHGTQLVVLSQHSDPPFAVVRALSNEPILQCVDAGGKVTATLDFSSDFNLFWWNAVLAPNDSTLYFLLLHAGLTEVRACDVTIRLIAWNVGG